MSRRFPISFDPWYRVLSAALLLLPSSAYVEILDAEVRVRMGWGFRATFPRTAVARTSLPSNHPLSRGVHGWAGKWLVNGSGRQIVAIDLEPEQRAKVMGFPVRLRCVMVSVEDPDGLRGALSGGGQVGAGR